MSPSSIDAYTLLTGATGLLGRALVRDLAAAGRRVAVVVRGSAAAPAADRVDELLDDWWQVAGASVPCPVVLEGDLSVDGLGLSAEQTAWIARHVREVVHSAASLSFQLRPADGEPYTSNVTGTRNVLALCRTAGIRRLHHVSSAYVCGLRRGTILEQMHQRQHVRVHGRIEMPLRRGRQRSEASGGGVVDQDVEPTELPAHEADHLGDVLLFADVGPDARDLAPQCGDPLRHRLGLRCARDEVDDDVGARLGEPQRTRPADAPAGPGDERDLSREIDHGRGDAPCDREGIWSATATASMWPSSTTKIPAPWTA